jgi:hypothetical protein
MTHTKNISNKRLTINPLLLDNRGGKINVCNNEMDLTNRTTIQVVDNNSRGKDVLSTPVDSNNMSAIVAPANGMHTTHSSNSTAG